MGSSSKRRDKDKESRKRRHGDGGEDPEPAREKRHKHKHKHHKEKRKAKSKNYHSDDSDVVEIIDSPPQPPSLQKSPSPPPAPSPPKVTEVSAETSRNTESLSIDETNKLRAKLGLKPLEVGSSDGGRGRDDGKKDGKFKDDLGEFYHKPAENWKDKAQQEKLRARLKEQREKRHHQSRLASVKLLAESDSDEEGNTEGWVKRSRQIEKERREAEKRAKLLEELDEQFGVSDIIESEESNRRKTMYSEKSLRGLKVNHDLESFGEEQTVILTLKDQGVLDENEDVLVNVNMMDDERYKKNVENKKKKIPYNPYDHEEFDEFGNPIEKSVLSKYDEEIEGQKQESFVIGGSSRGERKPTALEMTKNKLAKIRVESLATKELKIASEYYNEEELVQFKKPKKKIKKFRNKGKLSSDVVELVNNRGIEEVGSRRPKYKDDPWHYDIDDTPQITIPQVGLKLEESEVDYSSELNKIKKGKKKEDLTEIISQMKDEPDEEITNTGNNIVLDATAEFCRTLGDIPTFGNAGNRYDPADITPLAPPSPTPSATYSDDGLVSPVPEQSGWASVDPGLTTTTQPSLVPMPQEARILDEEPDVSTGVGAALRLATSKGYLDKERDKRVSNSRLAHLQAQCYSIEDKAYGEEGDRQGRRDRYAGPIVEFKEKETFKPNVKLEYIDDDGHILNSKEAFRYLSHKFHGKGPGKNKVEKRIKKGLQEQLMKKMSSTDTPLGTLNMLQAKQKETQSPFIVLSGGKQWQAQSLSKSRH